MTLLPRALVVALASLAACHNGAAPTLHATDATGEAAVVQVEPKVFGPAAIDAAIRADWARLNITPGASFAACTSTSSARSPRPTW
jgi:hypothetical protein